MDEHQAESNLLGVFIHLFFNLKMSEKNKHTMKKYNQAPLPFQGQKRRFLKDFKEALNRTNPRARYVDLFGGSGLLSHTVKQQYPDAEVYYNDYDNYCQRLANIPRTNALLAAIRPLLAGMAKRERLSEDRQRQVLELVRKQDGFVDYITLSANLLFSGKYATGYEELAKSGMYNKMSQAAYNADGYLDGVERIHMDYKAAFSYYSGRNTVWIVDPPYLSTDCSTYGSDDYWKLADYLDVLNVLRAGQYYYFTSDKSQLLDLCDWLSTHTGWNPFDGSEVRTVSGTVNYGSRYRDIMVYKVKGNE